MDFMTVFEGAIGGLLLLGSIGLAIYVTANGKEVKTWKPFGWSGVLGVMILVSAAFTAGDAPTYSRTTVEPVATIVNAIGGLLLLAALAVSMYLSMNEKKEVSTWKPLVWGAVVGAVLLGISF
jgi:drug/metabolite transporter (DMT)-like permease